MSVVAARFGDWLLSKVGWIAGAAGLACCLWLGFQLLDAKAQGKARGEVIVDLRAENSKLAADLSTARTNEATLEAALDRQTDQLRNLSVESERRITETRDALQRATAARLAAERRAADALTYQPQGSTVCERLLDVDRMIAEALR